MTRHRRWGIGLACALALLASGAAMAAKPKGDGGVRGEDVVRLLQDAGYRAKLERDAGGDPLVQTRMSGVNVDVYFYDCERGRCGSLQFLVGLDLDDGIASDRVLAFNREFRYVRAYLDDERDPFLAYDFEMLHVAHDAHFASQLALWEELLGEFLAATGYRKAEPRDDSEADDGGGAVSHADAEDVAAR